MFGCEGSSSPERTQSPGSAVSSCPLRVAQCSPSQCSPSQCSPRSCLQAEACVSAKGRIKNDKQYLVYSNAHDIQVSKDTAIMLFYISCFYVRLHNNQRFTQFLGSNV